MQHFPFVPARQLLWDPNAWRKPAYLAFIIRTLEATVAEGFERPEDQAEALMLIKKLYLAGKKPAGAI